MVKMLENIVNMVEKISIWEIILLIILVDILKPMRDEFARDAYRILKHLVLKKIKKH
ncbi:hypothetical protein ACFLY8_05355 [Halobacteriota archaeon]